MNIVELVRLEESSAGTLGILKINKQVFCYTLEPPDNENAANISSIPAQQYICQKYSSPKYPNTFEVTNVPGRTHILFHAGNTVEHTEGCVLLGATVGKLKGNRGLLNSGATFQAFLRVIGNDKEFHLTIAEKY